MNCAVIYSSKTGNTQKVAEAIFEAMPEGTQLLDVASVPEKARFDFVAMGFWVDKGTANKEACEFMNTLRDTKVFTFFTLGAYADSEHANSCLITANTLYGEGCDVVGSFRCQGAIDPKLIEWMTKLPDDHPHAPDEARRMRWSDAAKHPDASDLSRAKIAIKDVLKRINV